MTYRTAPTGPAGGGLASETAPGEFAILDTLPVGIVVLRIDASLVYANDAAHALFETAVQTLSLADTLCPIDAREIQDHLHAGSQFEALVAGQHHHRHVTVSVAEVAGDGERDFVLSITDITALKRATERAEFLAHHDPLTRLGNRALLQSVWDVLEERLATGRVEIHAMALDLDHFKQVNDLHGHAMGDIVLRQAANRLRQVVGEAGHVFRFGGDEFFVLVDDVPRSLALELAHMIVAELRRPMTILGNEVMIGCSVGIASAPLDGMMRDALHRAADLALYEVKRSGRGDVACFDPMQEQSHLDRRLLQADLVLALANDALEMAFLPQFDSRTCRLEAYDVAVTWTNKRNGRTIDGSDLLTLAEDTGLRHILDLWTVRTAIDRFMDLTWEADGDRSLSLAIGAATLIRENTTAILADALAEHDLPAHRLEVQISEAAVLAAGDELADAIGRLHELGVRLVVDGFCAQRPTLGYLRSLGVERVKLDRRTAHHLLGQEETDADALIEAVWVLCTRLGIELSTDGVETAQQWDSLRRIGRVRAQGPFFGAPESSASGIDRPARDEASA